MEVDLLSLVLIKVPVQHRERGTCSEILSHCCVTATSSIILGPNRKQMATVLKTGPAASSLTH